MRPCNTVSFLSVVGLTVLLSLAGTVRADIPEGDVYLEVSGGTLLTGLISEDGLTYTVGPRVFYAEFGADVANMTDEPGVQSLPGGLGLAASFRFDFQRALRRWNGTDFATIALESMTADLGPLTATSPAADTVSPGITVNVDPTGSHQHPEWTLNTPASNGVYLLELRYSTDTGFSSQPVWMLWGQNVDETTAQAAYDFGVANIPAPGASFLAAGAMGITARRRRHTPQ